MSGFEVGLRESRAMCEWLLDRITRTSSDPRRWAPRWLRHLAGGEGAPPKDKLEHELMLLQLFDVPTI
jgi:hypothetical protein